jgi:DNA-directed RNA polymerase subunit RPC12/RpoP
MKIRVGKSPFVFIHQKLDAEVKYTGFEEFGRKYGYYLCLSCGSGPEKHLNKPDKIIYTQGDFCPKCGEPDMKPHQRIIDNETRMDGIEKTCSRCEHKILTPCYYNLTGSPLPPEPKVQPPKPCYNKQTWLEWELKIERQFAVRLVPEEPQHVTQMFETDGGYWDARVPPEDEFRPF